MRNITIITLIGLASISGFAPASAQTDEFAPLPCVDASSGLQATRERPGTYLGNVKGDLTGALSLFTLESWEDVKGVVTSLVIVHYLSSETKDDSFTALLEVREPINSTFYKYHGTGSFREGSGIFTGIEGKLEISGGMASRKGILEGELRAGFCTG